MSRKSRRMVHNAAVETLEKRMLLCGLPYEHIEPVELRPDLVGVEPAREGGQAFINWTNRGQASDRFNTVFGTNAATARSVVDAVLAAYMDMIESFNYSDGSTVFNLTVTMGTTNSLGASANLSTTLGGKPKSGSITMGPGNNGSGGGWYLDPLPQDHTEFTGNLEHAFAGDAQSGSPAFNLSDFYTVVAAEVAHCLGLFGGTGVVPLWDARTTETNITDNDEGGGLGDFWVFEGPSIRHLMTDNNAGGNGNEFAGAVHTAGPGANINFDGTNWRGADDAGNVSYETGRRYLVPDTLGLMFKDAYSYTVKPASSRDSFHAVLNRDTGELLIRGGFETGSSDNINITFDGTNIDVSVDVGTDVPGTGSFPGAGNLPAYTSSFYQLDVTSIRIEGRDGNDNILLDEIPANIPVVIDAGSGDDTIRIGDSSNSLNGIDSNVTVIGGTGTDDVLLDDSLNDLVDDTYTFDLSGSNTTFDRGAFPLVTMSTIEAIEVLGSSGFETFNVNRLSSAVDLIIRAGAGNDSINVGSVTNDLDLVSGDIDVYGETGTDTINLLDTADTSNNSYTLGDGRVNHVLDRSGAAGSVSFGATTDAVNISAGSGGSVFTFNELNSATDIVVNAGGGNDSLSLMATGQNLSTIAGNVTFNGEAGTDTVSLHDQLNAVNSTYTATHNSLSRPGAGAFSFASTTESITLNGGSGLNFYIVDPSGVSLATDLIVNAGANHDTFQVTPTSHNMQWVINADLTFNGGGGNDLLTLFDASSTSTFPYVIDADSIIRGAMPTNFSGLESISLRCASGNNTISVVSNATVLSVDGGGGNDTMIIGGSGQNLDVITANVTFSGNTGTDSIELRDQQNPDSDAYTMTLSSFDRTNFPIVSFDTAESVIVQGGAGNNAFQLISTLATTNWTLRGNAGSDTFNLNSLANQIDLIDGPVTVEGGDGTDAMVINDTGYTGSAGFGVSSSVVSRTGFAGATYATIESITLSAGTATGTGDKNHQIQSLAAGTTLTLNAGNGDDAILVTPVTQDLANIAGNVTVNGQNGSDILEFNDDLFTGTGTYIVGGSQVQRGTGGIFSHGTIEQLRIDSGSGGATFNITGVSVANPLQLNTGGGNDLINIGSGINLLNSFGGLITLDAGTGTDSVALTDSGGAFDTNYTITSSLISRSATGFAGLAYSAVESLTVHGTQTLNTFAVQSLLSTTSLALNGNGGNDTFNLGSTTNNVGTLAGSMSINGGNGSDALNFNDQSETGALGFTLTPTTVARSGMGVATYATLEQITINSGGGSTKFHNFNGTAAGTPVRHNPGPNRDIIEITETSPTGPISIGASTGGDSVDLNLDNTGEAHAVFDASITMGALNIGNGGSATVVQNGSIVLRPFGIGLGSGARLDLNDNTLIADYTVGSPLNTVRTALTSGYNAGGWNGNGILSSAVAANPGFALGYAEASALFTTFPASLAGQDVDNTTVLVRYTRYGDTDLDKDVDLDDFNRLAANFGASGTLWSQANVNYDNFTNLDDFNLLAGNFGLAAGAIPFSRGSRAIGDDILRSFDPYTTDVPILVA